MQNSSDSWFETATDWLIAAGPEPLPAELVEVLGAADASELEMWVDFLQQFVVTTASASTPTTSRPRLRSLLQLIAARTLRLRLQQNDNQLCPAIDPDRVADLAHELMADNSLAAAHCLQILSAQGDTQSLETLCRLLKELDWQDEQGVAVALSPLFQWPPPQLASLFQCLGEDLWKWQLLGTMLDLAGYGVRSGKLPTHPLAHHGQRLRELLGQTVQRLSKLEQDPQRFGQDVESIQRVLASAVALTVSLCDTLGLIGDEQAEGKLNQALVLSHRRVQTEAAGALARLGKSSGRERLVELASDPMARLRAIAYAEELGFDQQIAATLRTPQALAEAEAVVWLADRERFGYPPTAIELVDARTQFWPSYEEPQNCFLWRFSYEFSSGELSNYVMSGPMVFAFQADLRSLEVDDVYAIFAGWQAEHEEIYEVPSSQFNASQRAECERTLRALEACGVDELHPLALTFFFGERAILATGQRQAIRVCALSDELETIIQPIDERPTSLTPDLVLALYRGRKLLRTFNP